SANGAVARTQEIRAELSRTLSALQDAETGQRGFLLTGDLHYLAPYRTVRRTIPEHIARLDVLTSGDAEQRGLVVELRAAAAGKLGELRDTIAVFRRSGFRAAQRAVKTGRGKEAMDRVRHAVAALSRNEDAAFLRRSRVAAAALQGA